MAKANKPVSDVYRLILEGNSKSDILEWVNENHKKADAEQVYTEAVSVFGEAVLDKSTALGFCQESARELYRSMREAGDYSGALRAIQELAKLSDAYAAGKNLGEGKAVAKPKDRKTDLLKLIRSESG